MMTDNQVIATTILQQLGGQGRLRAMTGAKDFLAIDRGLQFHLPANFARNGVNNIRVKLDDSDTYTVELGKIGRRNKRTFETPYTVLETHDGIYCDMLRGLISERTGLALSL